MCGFAQRKLWYRYLVEQCYHIHTEIKLIHLNNYTCILNINLNKGENIIKTQIRRETIFLCCFYFSFLSLFSYTLSWWIIQVLFPEHAYCKICSCFLIASNTKPNWNHLYHAHSVEMNAWGPSKVCEVSLNIRK